MIGWLEELDPAVLDFWCAFDRVEPISSDWQHTGTMAAAAINSAAVFAASQGVEIPQRTAESFAPRIVPVEAGQPDRPSGRMSGEEIRAEMQKRLRT